MTYQGDCYFLQHTHQRLEFTPLALHHEVQQLKKKRQPLEKPLQAWPGFSNHRGLQKVRKDEGQQQKGYLFLSDSWKEGNFLCKAALRPVV